MLSKNEDEHLFLGKWTSLRHEGYFYVAGFLKDSVLFVSLNLNKWTWRLPQESLKVQVEKLQTLKCSASNFKRQPSNFRKIIDDGRI